MDIALRPWLLLWTIGNLLVVTAKGVILCECTTEECREEGKSTCYSSHSCYSQYFKDTLTRGCIDGSSLLCENRKPEGFGISNWPVMKCCHDKNFCNRGVSPTLPPDPEVAVQPEDQDASPPAGGARPDPHVPPVRCPDAAANDDNNKSDGSDNGAIRTSSNGSASGGGSKVINPIYIAVPVAGVCVLLALVIFAMYLLRRRSHHHYDSYHHYHDHLAHLSPHGHKHPRAGGPREGGIGGGGGGGGGSGVGGGGVPLYHHHHHCDCICQKSLPPCGGKVNRCTDSERSSSGSETKLFLQA